MVETYEGITYLRKDNIGYIQLDRPPVNAFSVSMVKGLGEILNDAENDSKVKVVVLAGSGKYFSTGMDLKEVDVFNVQLISEIQRFSFNPVVARLYRYSKPTICELNGTAAGAGLAFALGCDMIYAHTSARMAFNTIDKGLLFACGGGYLLRQTVGERRAKEILFCGSLLTAKEALEEELVTKAFKDKNELHMTVERAAGQLAQKSPVVLSAVKKIMSRDAVEFQKYLDVEVVLQRSCLESKEFQEAMKKFLKKKCV